MDAGTRHAASHADPAAPRDMASSSDSEAGAGERLDWTPALSPESVQSSRSDFSSDSDRSESSVFSQVCAAAPAAHPRHHSGIGRLAASHAIIRRGTV